MIREFIYTAKFDREWSALGLSDDDLCLLESFLLENPTAGAIMAGTGGIRKLRWILPHIGKSGGVRVLYIDYLAYSKICVFDIFTKDEKDNLSRAERSSLKQIVKAIGEEFRK